MKLSDYVVKFIESKADAVFLLPGGGIMHVIDSIGKSEKLKKIVCHHEQAVAIAAEGYARMKNSPGFAVVTSGPGGTNAITGVAGAWLDSIPMFVISGQVKTDNILPRENGAPLIRALGFQELNIVDLVKPVTKYAVMLEDAKDIRFHLEKAWASATTGRPGPVWLDLPLDLTAAEINEDELIGFKEEGQEAYYKTNSEQIRQAIEKLKQAKRPLLMAGNGIRLAGAEDLLKKLLEKWQINAATPMFTADDLVTYDYPKYLGRQGMMGNESANYAVDNCDLLLVIGDRLQLTQTSYEYEKFATQAYKIMVDVDRQEMVKKTLKIDLPVELDAKIFLEELLKADIAINTWEVERKLMDPEKFKGGENYVNVYRVMDELGKNAEKLAVTTGDGTASVASHQALKIAPGQRFLTNAGLGHMGSGLPLAIGACVAGGGKPVICLEGDGSIMLNIHEFQTALYNKLPIKIFILNNNGYVSIRNTHKKFFGKVFAADPSSGISFPDFSKLVPGWQLPYERIANDGELDKIRKVLDFDGPIICELIIDPEQPMPERWSAGMLRE